MAEPNNFVMLYKGGEAERRVWKKHYSDGFQTMVQAFCGYDIDSGRAVTGVFYVDREKGGTRLLHYAAKSGPYDIVSAYRAMLIMSQLPEVWPDAITMACRAAERKGSTPVKYRIAKWVGIEAYRQAMRSHPIELERALSSLVSHQVRIETASLSHEVSFGKLELTPYLQKLGVEPPGLYKPKAVSARRVLAISKSYLQAYYGGMKRQPSGRFDRVVREYVVEGARKGYDEPDLVASWAMVAARHHLWAVRQQQAQIDQVSSKEQRRADFLRRAIREMATLASGSLSKVGLEVLCYRSVVGACSVAQVEPTTQLETRSYSAYHSQLTQMSREWNDRPVVVLA